MIEFKGVHKTYDNGTKALRDVNIHIDKGEFVFIVGASGSGKSTFLKLIMREERPNAGEVIVNGFKLNKLRRRKVPYLRRTMGIVFQDFRLINNMTVFDNVAFAMRVIGAREKEIRDRVPYVLDLVGLETKAKRHPGELSGGERQRVGIARVMLTNPDMLVMDEPTSALDIINEKGLLKTLDEEYKDKMIMIVSHRRSTLTDCNRILTVNGGKLTEKTL